MGINGEPKLGGEINFNDLSYSEQLTQIDRVAAGVQAHWDPLFPDPSLFSNARMLIGLLGKLVATPDEKAREQTRINHLRHRLMEVITSAPDLEDKTVGIKPH